MNILLDRFPISTCENLKTSLEKIGYQVPLSILVHASHKNQTFDGEYYLDRDIAFGKLSQKTPWVLSRKDLELATKYESFAIGVIARLDINQSYFSVEEMTAHYIDIYNFWLNEIRCRNINFCIHHYIPHDPSSFILYIVLKNYRIPTVYIDTPHVFNKYRFLSCSFKHRGLLLSSKKESFVFRKHFQNYKKNISKGSILALPQSVRYRHEDKNKRLSTKINFYIKQFSSLKFWKRKLRYKYFVHLLSPSPHFFKISRFAWTSSKNRYSNLYFNFLSFCKSINLKLNYHKYEKLCTPVPKSKYVYFAIPGQPEGSTMPVALSFRELFTTIRTLREATPSSIPLVLKENPGVFDTKNPYLSFVNYRAPDFYERLLSIPNLLLVSTEEDSHKLIKNSVITSTINGTAAIEAFTFGIPAITFASNWYDGLFGIHKFEHPEKLHSFITNILENENLINLNSGEFINLDSNLMIEFDVHGLELSQKSIPNLVSACISAIDKFNSLDDRKWEF